ncbi:hypothetical protein BCF88_10225 [Metamycoplasma alkalescens]|uniref:Uncharacterized protein n=1 Tax=Metamycoplasma alkalescens TaxID=45363 RepID=A0A318U5P5_9BACT|nr:hypothetical protein BCF88_10225 [Metamycoplasma alkalescens]
MYFEDFFALIWIEPVFSSSAFLKSNISNSSLFNISMFIFSAIAFKIDSSVKIGYLSNTSVQLIESNGNFLISSFNCSSFFSDESDWFSCLFIFLFWFSFCGLSFGNFSSWWLFVLLSFRSFGIMIFIWPIKYLDFLVVVISIKPCFSISAFLILISRSFSNSSSLMAVFEIKVFKISSFLIWFEGFIYKFNFEISIFCFLLSSCFWLLQEIAIKGNKDIGNKILVIIFIFFHL